MQASFAQNQEMVQAFPPHTAQEVLTYGIGFWRLTGRGQVLYSAPIRHSREGIPELVVIGANQEARTLTNLGFFWPSNSSRAENGIATGLLWALCACRRHEPLPLRLLQRPCAGVHLLQRHGQPLPEAHFWTAVGPRLCRAQVNIHIEVPRVEATLRVEEKLSNDRLGEPSAAVRKRVEAARARPSRAGLPLVAACPVRRDKAAAHLHCAPTGGSARVGPAEVREYCRLDDVPAMLGWGRACHARRASRRRHLHLQRRCKCAAAAHERAGVPPDSEAGADDF
jgi:hypothetical protein